MRESRLRGSVRGARGNSRPYRDHASCGQMWQMTQCMVRPCVAREFCRYGGSGLASMYPAFDWSVSLLAIMGISAGAISLAERPDRAIWVTSVRTRREDRTSISSHPLADLGGKVILIWLRHRGLLILRGPMPSARNMDHADWVAASIFRTSKPRPRASTLQAMRASLLASAIASTLWCSRFLAASIQGLSP